MERALNGILVATPALAPGPEGNHDRAEPMCGGTSWRAMLRYGHRARSAHLSTRTTARGRRSSIRGDAYPARQIGFPSAHLGDLGTTVEKLNRARHRCASSMRFCQRQTKPQLITRRDGHARFRPTQARENRQRDGRRLRADRQVRSDGGFGAYYAPARGVCQWSVAELEVAPFTSVSTMNGSSAESWPSSPAALPIDIKLAIGGNSVVCDHRNEVVSRCNRRIL